MLDPNFELVVAIIIIIIIFNSIYIYTLIIILLIAGAAVENPIWRKIESASTREEPKLIEYAKKSLNNIGSRTLLKDLEKEIREDNFEDKSKLTRKNIKLYYRCSRGFYHQWQL